MWTVNCNRVSCAESTLLLHWFWHKFFNIKKNFSLVRVDAVDNRWLADLLLPYKKLALFIWFNGLWPQLYIIHNCNCNKILQTTLGLPNEEDSFEFGKLVDGIKCHEGWKRPTDFGLFHNENLVINKHLVIYFAIYDKAKRLSQDVNSLIANAFLAFLFTSSEINSCCLSRDSWLRYINM